MRGESIYADWRQSPHVATVYGPLSYLLPGWIGRFLGAAPLDLYVIGRCLSLLCTLGAGLTVYALARRFATGRPLALLAALATISSPVFWTIGGELRPEPPAVFCSLLAVWWFVRFRATRAWWLAGSFIGLAFLFKQSAVLPLPAIALALWTAGRRRAAVAFAAAVVAGLAAIVLILDAATDGRYWLNAFRALSGNRTLSNLAIWPAAVLPIALAQYALAFIWLRRRWTAHRLGVAEYYFLVASILPFLMTWRDGAAEYYFCESVAAASILMTCLWHSWCAPTTSPEPPAWPEPPASTGALSDPSASVAGSTHRLRLAAALLPAAVAVAALLQLGPGLPRRLDDAWRASPLAAAERARWGELLARFDALPQPVLCEIDGLTALGGHPPVILDTWLFSGLIDRGVFDDRAIRLALEEQRFGSVVLRLPVPGVRRYGSTAYVPRAWLDLIGRHYEPTGRLGEFHVYQPRPRLPALLRQPQSP
jgi:hypothetical protein